VLKCIYYGAQLCGVYTQVLEKVLHTVNVCSISMCIHEKIYTNTPCVHPVVCLWYCHTDAHVEINEQIESLVFYLFFTVADG